MKFETLRIRRYFMQPVEPPLRAPGVSKPNPRVSLAGTHEISGALSQDFGHTIAEQRASNEISSFIAMSLDKAKGDGDRVFAFQSGFEMLACEFQIVRPLIERIKHEYDSVYQSLLSTKRTLLTEGDSVAMADAQFNESVRHLRRARVQEFSHNRAESEQLIDRMTDFRLQRSEMMGQIEALTGQREEMQAKQRDQADRLREFNITISELTAIIGDTEDAVNACEEEVRAMKESSEQSEISIEGLRENGKKMKTEFRTVKGERDALKDRLFDLDEATGEIRQLSIELNCELEKLTEEKKIAEKRRKEARERLDAAEKMLRSVAGDAVTPLSELMESA